MNYPWWRRLLIIIPLMLGAGIFSYFASNKQPPKQKQAAEQSHFTRVIIAREMDVIPKVLGYGTVSAARVWNIIARVSGEIEFIHPQFKKGAILKAGTEVIRISPRDYELQIRQAQANIRSAQAKTDELAIQQKSVRLSLKIEKRGFKLKQTQLARMQKLKQRGTIAQATLEAEENTTLIQQQKVQDIQNTLDLIPSRINAQKEQRAVYESQLAQAKLNLERIHIRLPFDARISQANVELTQYVQTGKNMGAADSTKAVEIEAQIPISHFQQFMGTMLGGKTLARIEGDTLKQLVRKRGMHAIVRLPLSKVGALWRGQIIRVSDSIDPKTRTVGVVIGVDKPYEKIIPGKRPLLGKGMFVEVELRSNPLGQMIIVPRSALHESQLYMLNKENRLETRSIEIDFIQGNIAVLAKGVVEGERIIVSDLLFATDGMLMEMTEDKKLAALMRIEASGEGAPR